MSLSSAVLAEFGQSLGIADLQWPPSKRLTLSFDLRGTLYLEDRDETLLMYLVRPIDPGKPLGAVLKSALQYCHYRQGLPFTVQPGLRGDTDLVFLVRLSSRSANLPDMERILETLTTLHNAVQA